MSSKNWQVAEQATQAILKCIQPTVESERKRGAVIEYVGKLIRRSIGKEVLALGSVPLKTYLPGGDIDLTVLAVPNVVDAIHEVRAILEVEENKKDAEFEVENVQYINAEVKLVKCLVQSIRVDISFGQTGGLRTLYFLEMVNRLIGKNNLFKQSIILIKAWFYYESRLLGARYALISTYGLEILVLFVFQLFHSSLNGPLAVLYRFLEYYSTFDWDNYCISLYGPISLSALSELVVEAPESDGDDLLLTRDFIQECLQTFSNPLMEAESYSKSFTKKRINILDPLKLNNNLGLSVSDGNSYRIRRAITSGAETLGSILSMSPDICTSEINNFFIVTLDMHGTGIKPYLQGSNFRHPKSEILYLNGPNLDQLQLIFENSKRATDNIGALSEEINNINISRLDTVSAQWRAEYHHRQSWNDVSWSNTHNHQIQVFRVPGFCSAVHYPMNPALIQFNGRMGYMTRTHRAGTIYPNLVNSVADSRENIRNPPGTGAFIPKRAYIYRDSRRSLGNRAPINRLLGFNNDQCIETVQYTNVRGNRSHDPVSQAQVHLSDPNVHGKTAQS